MNWSLANAPYETGHMREDALLEEGAIALPGASVSEQRDDGGPARNMRERPKFALEAL